MGSAIGNYVHYRLSNYEKYGINHKDEGASAAYDFSAQKAKMKAKWTGKSKMSDVEKEELRKNLSFIFSDTSDNQSVKKIQNAITEQLIARFKEAMGTINWGTGDVVSISDSVTLNKKEQSLNYIRTEKQQKTIFINTLWKRISALQTMVSGISRRSTKTKLTAQINQVKQQLEELTGLSEEYLSKCQIGGDALDLDSAKSLIEQLNGIIRGTKASIPVQRGDLFEYAAALAKLVGQNIGQTEIKEALKNVVGGNADQTVVVKDNFTNAVDWGSLNLKESIDDYGNSVVIIGNKSQQKVDVAYQLSDGGNVGISAKSINSGSGKDISIVSGSPLLYLIGDEDATFVNHYLNIVSSHKDRKPDSSLISAAHEAMKVTLFYKALSGNTQNREAADILLINDNKSGGIASIQIYDINDLVNKAAENIDAYTSITVNGTKTRLDSTYLVNAWEDSGWEARITKLVQQLHAQKISAALKVSALNLTT